MNEFHPRGKPRTPLFRWSQPSFLSSRPALCIFVSLYPLGSPNGAFSLHHLHTPSPPLSCLAMQRLSGHHVHVLALPSFPCTAITALSHSSKPAPTCPPTCSTCIALHHLGNLAHFRTN